MHVRKMDENPVKNDSIDLEEKQIREAVSALFAYVRKDKGKKTLVDEGEKVNLQLTFKKIPQAKNIAIKIPLPHGLYDLKENAEICLFVKDLNKKDRDYSPTVHHFKELLEKKNVTCISEIIPLKCLKTEYKPFEAKRNLSNRFDIYLSDERIVRLLPCFLGKHFYGRKRQPVQVNLNCVDLQKEISRAIHDTRCIIGGRGSSCSVTVGHTDMTEESTVQNIICAAQKLAASIPGGSVNVRNLYVKTTSAPALPIYVSLGSANEVELPKRENKKTEDEPEEVTTVLFGKVKVSPYGKVTIVNKRTEKKQLQRKGKVRGKRTRGGKAKKSNNRVIEVKSESVSDTDVKVKLEPQGEEGPPSKRAKSTAKQTNNIRQLKTEKLKNEKADSLADDSIQTPTQKKKVRAKKVDNKIQVKEETTDGGYEAAEKSLPQKQSDNSVKPKTNNKAGRKRKASI